MVPHRFQLLTTLGQKRCFSCFLGRVVSRCFCAEWLTCRLPVSCGVASFPVTYYPRAKSLFFVFSGEGSKSLFSCWAVNVQITSELWRRIISSYLLPSGKRGCSLRQEGLFVVQELWQKRLLAGDSAKGAVCCAGVSANLWYGVVAAAAPWIATQDASDRQIQTFKRTVFFEGFHGVCRTRRRKTTRRRGEGGNTKLVALNDQNQGQTQYFFDRCQKNTKEGCPFSFLYSPTV